VTQHAIIRRPKRCRLMSPAVISIAIAAFLSGVVAAVFAMLVATIHAGDRPGRLTAEPPPGQPESLIRTILGVGVHTDGDPEE
jgi:hypothetical protein